MKGRIASRLRAFCCFRNHANGRPEHVIGVNVALNARGYTWPGVFHGRVRENGSHATVAHRDSTRYAGFVSNFDGAKVLFGDFGTEYIYGVWIKFANM
jgi:hypothetical protein